MGFNQGSTGGGTSYTHIDSSWDGLDSHRRFNVSIAHFYVKQFGEMLKTLQRSATNQEEQLCIALQSNNKDMCSWFETLLKSTSNDNARVQKNPSFLQAKDAVRDHQLVDLEVIKPIEHDALEHAVASRLGIEINDAHQIASKRMALIETLKETVLTLCQQQSELASTDNIKQYITYT